MSKKKIRRPHPVRQSKPKKPMDPAVKKRILIVCAALLAVLLLALAWYILIYEDGSLRVTRGTVPGKEDTWLIADRGRGKRSDYYHIADVALPEGYAIAAEPGLGVAISPTDSVDLKNYFTFAPADESSMIEDIIVYPCAVPLDEMMANAWESYEQRASSLIEGAPAGSISAVESVKTDAGEGQRFYCDYAYFSDDAGKYRYAQSVIAYLPTRYDDCCILVAVNAYPESAEAKLSMDAMYAEFDKTLSAITTVKSEK